MAFGSFSRDSHAPMAEINTTPLVDVMLVLLVVFIVTAPLLTHSVAVALPRASAEQHADRPEAIRLTIDTTGQLFWNDTPLALDALPERLRARVAATPDVSVQLHADRDTRYDTVAQVMAAARSAGVERLGFITEAR
ncbi:biopolymer transporter ExbD [Laribacter hongkongensis]|uniref:ExbD/TolR family protein n=1 Tax=Laribacter hongkongensis TaxID=168471 RepID=UPI001878A415|nr:biopolymer transporter ExbD [Laribacter hongkongensis]MBE5527356.1 biopolymer transporter ExbD [Laribacter hongkongensis]